MSGTKCAQLRTSLMTFPRCYATLPSDDYHTEPIICTGDQFSTADVHLSAWLAYVVFLAGGSPSEAGVSAIDKLEKHIGAGFLLPRISEAAGTSGVGDESTPKAADGEPPKTTTKLGVFWDAAKERVSWKAVEEALAK